jgi:hypothetical protein
MENDNAVDRSHIGEGHYANHAEIAYNFREFVFDFGQVWLGGKPAGVYVRVITSPDTAERIHALLDDALARYRWQYGEIRHEAEGDERKP